MNLHERRLHKFDKRLAERIDTINKDINVKDALKRVYNNDFEETQRLAELIGIDSAADLEDFISKEGLIDEEPIDTLKRYINATFGDTIAVKECKALKEDREEDADREIEARRNREQLIICIDVSGSLNNETDRINAVVDQLVPDKVYYFDGDVHLDPKMHYGSTNYEELYRSVINKKRPNDIIYVLTDYDFKGYMADANSRYRNCYRSIQDWTKPNIYVLDVRNHFDPLTSNGRGKYSKYFSGDLDIVSSNAREEAKAEVTATAKRDQEIKSMTGRDADIKAHKTGFKQYNDANKNISTPAPTKAATSWLEDPSYDDIFSDSF